MTTIAAEIMRSQAKLPASQTATVFFKVLNRTTSPFNRLNWTVTPNAAAH